jgi:hypothetical protein
VFTVQPPDTTVEVPELPPFSVPVGTLGYEGTGRPVGDRTGEHRLFAGMQALGQGLSPLVSGPSAALDWRLAFAFPAFVAAVLAMLPPTMTADDRAAAVSMTSAGRWWALVNRRLAVACAISFLCYFAAVGLTVLSVFRAGEQFGLGPWERGLVASSFGLAGLAAAPALAGCSTLPGRAASAC